MAHIAQVHRLKQLFLQEEWKVEKLQPSTKLYSTNAIILVPDTAGLNCNVSYVKSAFIPTIPAQDAGVEYWRLNLMHYYVKKRIPILGIGTSACLIFGELCGNLIYGRDGLSFGAPRKDRVIDSGNDWFIGKNCAGMQTFQVDENLSMFAEALLPKAPDGDSAMVPVLV